MATKMITIRAVTDGIAGGQTNAFGQSFSLVN
jgi:hypothetical protein